MLAFAENYYDLLYGIIQSITIADSAGNKFSFAEGIEKAASVIISNTSAGRKIMFIGNGGSASISSHMATDFLKNGNMRALTFNDSALLTCLGNDYGYKHVFEKPIDMMAAQDDVLIAISSSGRSENILRGVEAARSKGCFIITLSGFDSDNPLSTRGNMNFYVPSKSYGHVEIIHHSICHCLLDSILNAGKVKELQHN